MISLIHDDSVNLADLQNKIIEIQDYLNTRKNDIINNMVSLNIENYTIDDNQYYKKLNDTIIQSILWILKRLLEV